MNEIYVSGPRKKAIISTKVWREMRMLRLPHEAQLLYIFLLTNEYCSAYGFYFLPKNTLSPVVDNIDQSLQILAKHKLAIYDQTIECIVIPAWFQHNSAEYAINQKIFLRLYERVPHFSPVFEYIVKLSGRRVPPLLRRVAQPRW